MTEKSKAMRQWRRGWGWGYHGQEKKSQDGGKASMLKTEQKKSGMEASLELVASLARGKSRVSLPPGPFRLLLTDS